MRTAIVIVMVVAGSAHADDRWAAHPFGVETEVGLGTPSGLLGAGLDWTPRSWLSLEAKMGAERSWGIIDGADAAQLAFMARGRWVYGGLGLSFGAGVSTGPYKACPTCGFDNHGDHYTVPTADWLDVETSIEHRWASGISLRLAVGASRLLDPGSVMCDPYDANCSRPPNEFHHFEPYLGIGFRLPLPF